MFKNKAIALSVLGLALATSGCQSDLVRHDGVTTFAGNSHPANEAKMVADPWKRNAYNDHLHGDGQRLGDVVKRYKTAHGEDATAAPPAILLPSAPASETR